MSPLYDLILQRKGELQTETVQVADAAQAWRLGVSATPTASAVLCVAMRGVMAPRLSHPNAAKRRASEQPGMELRLESRALNEAVEATAQFFKTQRVVACCGDRLTLACFCLAEPIRWAVVGPPPLKRRGLNCCCATSRAC